MILKEPQYRNTIAGVSRFSDGTVGLTMGPIAAHYVSIADELKGKRVDLEDVVTIVGGLNGHSGDQWPSVREIHGDGAHVALRSKMPALVRVIGVLQLDKGAEARRLKEVGGDLATEIALPELISVSGSAFLKRGAQAPKLLFVGSTLLVEDGAVVNADCTAMMGMHKVHEALNNFETHSRTIAVRLAGAIERISEAETEGVMDPGVIL